MYSPSLPVFSGNKLERMSWKVYLENELLCLLVCRYFRHRDSRFTFEFNKCRLDAPVLDLRSLQPLACYRGFGAGSLIQPSVAAISQSPQSRSRSPVELSDSIGLIALARHDKLASLSSLRNSQMHLLCSVPCKRQKSPTETTHTGGLCDSQIL